MGSSDSKFEAMVPMAGAPAARRVVEATLLQNADVRWVRQVGWGVLMVAGAVGVDLWGAWRMVLEREMLRGMGLELGGACVGLVGVWMVGRAEGVRVREVPLAARGARWLAMAAVIFWLGAVVMVRGQRDGHWMIVLALLCMAGEAVLLGRFLAGLAERVPAEGLSNQLRLMGMLVPGFLGVMVVGQFWDLMGYWGVFFISYPVAGGLAGVMCWVGATLVRLFVALRRIN